MLHRNTNTEQARFDTRLSKEQKELFEYAAQLGGFRTLTDFVINSVQEKAKAIINQHAAILASKKDKEIFFNALLKPAAPNKKLMEAAVRYKKSLAKK
ncbi:MAG: DUF1778 domain-containing protein [Bacteroidota bacterium]|nr:DUF1778 domain-containing protein [Bacteroidota bacterium]